MHIAMISPPWFPVPPPSYGGTERVVYDVTESLVAMGHQVLLIAPAESQTSARLVPVVPQHLTLNLPRREMSIAWAKAGSYAYREAIAADVDVIHDHTDFPHGESLSIPVVRTMHLAATEEQVCKYLPMSCQGDRFVAISRRQRDLYQAKVQELYGSNERLNIAGVVHNPINVSDKPFRAQKEDFVLFLGRCDWEKNPDGAIRVARAAGLRLVMALRIAPYEQDYFQQAIQPLMGPDITFLGEIGTQERNDLLAQAAAVLFTSQWEEPFGLVMTEAMACGTPVLAFRRGSAAEVIVHRETGFLCDSEEEMIGYLHRLDEIDPQRCRRQAETRFAPEIAARGYLDIYETAIRG